MMIMTTTTNLQENTVKNYCIRVTCQISLHLPLNYFPCSIVFFIIVFVVFVRSLARCPHYRFASIQFTVSLASRVSPPLFYRHLATRITNVSHKILKFNKFSIINFNVIRLLHFLILVSCFGSFVETRFCGVCVFFSLSFLRVCEPSNFESGSIPHLISRAASAHIANHSHAHFVFVIRYNKLNLARFSFTLGFSSDSGVAVNFGMVFFVFQSGILARFRDIEI